MAVYEAYKLSFINTDKWQIMIEERDGMSYEPFDDADNQTMLSD
jgi:hypothetical protein